VMSSPSTRTRPAVVCWAIRSSDSPALVSRSCMVGVVGAGSSITTSWCVRAPTVFGQAGPAFRGRRVPLVMRSCIPAAQRPEGRSVSVMARHPVVGPTTQKILVACRASAPMREGGTRVEAQQSSVIHRRGGAAEREGRRVGQDDRHPRQRCGEDEENQTQPPRVVVEDSGQCEADQVHGHEDRVAPAAMVLLGGERWCGIRDQNRFHTRVPGHHPDAFPH